jgi:hypothetical protein
VWLYCVTGRASVSGAPLAADETLGWDAPESLSLQSEEGATVIAIHLNRRA